MGGRWEYCLGKSEHFTRPSVRESLRRSKSCRSSTLISRSGREIGYKERYWRRNLSIGESGWREWKLWNCRQIIRDRQCRVIGERVGISQCRERWRRG